METSNMERRFVFDTVMINNGNNSFYDLLVHNTPIAKEVIECYDHEMHCYDDWRGHEYSIFYLTDIYSAVHDLLLGIFNLTYWGAEGYGQIKKRPEICRHLTTMEIDFVKLFNKIDNDESFPKSVRDHILDDVLDSKFRDILDYGIELLTEAYGLTEIRNN